MPSFVEFYFYLFNTRVFFLLPLNTRSSMDRDVLYEIYDQLRVIRNEMSHLSEKVRDERRQRKRLQHSMAKLHQQQQQQQTLNT